MSAKTIRKTFRADIKGFDVEAQTVDAIVTTDSIDRDEEIVLPDGLDDSSFKNNPILMWNHDHGGPPSACLGKALSWERVPEGWLFKFWYDVETNPDAKMVFGLICSGCLRAYSIGFIAQAIVTARSTPEAIESLPPEARVRLLTGAAKTVYTRYELLEVSNTHLGSNRDALRCSLGKMSKGTSIKEDYILKTLLQSLDTKSEESVSAPAATPQETSQEAPTQDTAPAPKKKCYDEPYYCRTATHPLIADAATRLNSLANQLPDMVDPDKDGDIDNLSKLPAALAILGSIQADLQGLRIDDPDLGEEYATRSVQAPATSKSASVKGGQVISSANMAEFGKCMDHLEKGIRKCVKGMHVANEVMMSAGAASFVPKDFPDPLDEADDAVTGDSDDDTADSSVTTNSLDPDHLVRSLLG